MADDTVERDPEKIPATARPGRPGWKKVGASFVELISTNKRDRIKKIKDMQSTWNG